MFAPLIVDGEERRTMKGNRTKLTVSISRADVQEVLGKQAVPILEFIRKDSTANIPERPEIVLNVEKTFYVLKSSSGKKYMAPRLNIGWVFDRYFFSINSLMFCHFQIKLGKCEIRV